MRVLINLLESTKVDSEDYIAKKKTFLEIHPNQSIWMVKTLIFNAFNIPPARQKLFLYVIDENFPKEKSKCYSKLLHGYRLVKDYKIDHASEIQVVELEKDQPAEFLVPPPKNIHALNASSNNVEHTKSPKISALQPSGGSSSNNSNNNNNININNGNNKIHVLASKKGTCPALCFAIGKGLYRGISGVKYEIKLYRVDSKGVLIRSTNQNFEIDIIKEKSAVEDRKMPFTYEQRKSDYSVLTIMPSIYGDYSISIKIEDTPICGSPFHCTIIDELNPMLKELAFSNEWIEEIIELITLMSKKESTIDNLFTFGIEALINLMFYPDPAIQIHITGIFSKLIEKDKNKERILREHGIDFLFKIVTLEHWSSYIELRRFIASSLCILAFNKSFTMRFLSECGIEIISTLAKSDHIDCSRSCAIFLAQISENYEYSEYLTTDLIKESLIYMLSLKDNITVNCTLKAISNLSASFDLKKESNIKLLEQLLECCKTFTSDVARKVLIFKSFSNFVANESLCTYLILGGILDLITPKHDLNTGYFVGIPMFYQWELNSLQSVLGNKSYSSSFTDIFKDETDYVFFLSLTISNMLVTTNSIKIHSHFSTGSGLNLLKQFILCHEGSARAEAFRSFMLITSSPNDSCKRNLIQSGIIPYLVSSLFDSSKVETPFIINTLSNLCDYDSDCVESIGIDGVEKLIDLIKVNETVLHLPISMVLASLSKNDKFKSRIVNGAGKPFIQDLIEFVREGRVNVLKPISYQDIETHSELGKGVSGIVWKGVWKGNVVAIKSFNEEALGFNEREFLSEATIMSILRHPNIVHCIGGSRTQGRMFLVSDYYCRGSLYKVIHANEIPLSNAKIVHIALQAAIGMEYLHSLGIIHRDLKSGNLLIDQEWNVGICDFGVSRVVDNKRMTKAVGTPCYMAVEVLSGQTEYTQQADVYSFGVVLWECVSRLIPYHDQEQIDWIRCVLEQSFRPPIPTGCLPELASLIQECWVSDPLARPTFKQIIQRLEQLRTKLESSGLYEEFLNNKKERNAGDQGFYVGLNENNINTDMSMHQTEELKNLVEMDLNDPSLFSKSSSNSTSASTSPYSSAPVSPSESTSPTSPTSPPLANRKWERFVPDKPSINKNAKRLSAFRSHRDLNNPNNNNNNNSSSTANMSIPSTHNNGNNNNGLSSNSNGHHNIASSEATTTNSFSTDRNQDSFMSDGDPYGTSIKSHYSSEDSFDYKNRHFLPPPPLHPSSYTPILIHNSSNSTSNSLIDDNFINNNSNSLNNNNN
ncbi:hypothetical protein CYY_004384, partial [Polysphondylium violaceum]